MHCVEVLHARHKLILGTHTRGYILRRRFKTTDSPAHLTCFCLPVYGAKSALQVVIPKTVGDRHSVTSRVCWRRTISTGEGGEVQKKATSKLPTNSPVVSSKGCWNLYPLACEIPMVWRSRFAPTLLPELTPTCWQLTVVQAAEQIVQNHPVASRPLSTNKLRHPRQRYWSLSFLLSQHNARADSVLHTALYPSSPSKWEKRKYIISIP